MEKTESKAQIWQRANPIKFRAQQKVHAAISSGKLVRPETCSRCGTTGKIQGHHHDYSKPLDVWWLCIRCHRSEHKTTGIKNSRARLTEADVLKIRELAAHGIKHPNIAVKYKVSRSTISLIAERKTWKHL